MVATALGEEKPGTPESLGVVNVIRNRAIDGGYGGDTPTGVVTSPSQFSPWNDAAGRARMARGLQDPAAVAKVSDAIDQAYGTGKYVNAGPNDPTDGKTHFYDPASMVPAGSAPAWARGKETQRIGNTLFLDDPDEPAAPKVQVASSGAAPEAFAAPPQSATSPGVAAVTAAANGVPATAAPVAAAAPSPGVAKVTSAINPAIIAAATSPYADPTTKQLAIGMLQKAMSPKAAAPYKDADGNLLQAGPDGLLHAVIKADSSTPAVKDYEYGLTHPEFLSHSEKVLGHGGELYHTGPDGRPIIDHANTTAQEDVPQATVDFLADRVRMGDTSVKVGYARNPGMIAKIDSTAQQREEAGIPVSDAAKNVTENRVTLSARGSAERKLGTINTNNEFYGNNALGALDIAEKASAEVPRTDYPGVNKALNAYRTQTGDPKTVALGAALNTVVNDYAKFTGGGIGTDSLRGHAEEILNGAHSPEQLTAIVHMMRLEIQRGQQSPSMVRGGFDSLYAPRGSAVAPSAAPVAAVAPPAAAAVGPAENDVIHNPTTGETLIRKSGKWVPLS